MPESSNFVSRSSATPPLFAGVDVGGTNIKVGLVDSDGRTLAYHTFPTDVDRGPEEGCRRMADAVHKVAADAKAKPNEVVRIGLATPGTMDVPAGLLLEPHNLPGWWNFPIRDKLAEAARTPVTFANDANAAAYGEFWVGSGKQYNSMILLTLGTGIGGGIIIGGRLIEGEHSCGGEVGHIIIDMADDAMQDNAGKTGSLEAYASAGGVVRRAQMELARNKSSVLAASDPAGEGLTPKEIAEAAESGDALAKKVVLDTARYLGVGITTLVHTIDPESVVLGGAMTFGGGDNPLGREFLQTVRDEFNRRTFPTLKGKIIIDFASLGGDAGYLGAAGLARAAEGQ
jgi:glucokinase